jgi:hypothetical protein
MYIIIPLSTILHCESFPISLGGNPLVSTACSCSILPHIFILPPSLSPPSPLVVVVVCSLILGKDCFRALVLLGSVNGTVGTMEEGKEREACSSFELERRGADIFFCGFFVESEDGMGTGPLLSAGLATYLQQ